MSSCKGHVSILSHRKEHVILQLSFQGFWRTERTTSDNILMYAFCAKDSLALLCYQIHNTPSIELYLKSTTAKFYFTPWTLKSIRKQFLLLKNSSKRATIGKYLKRTDLEMELNWLLATSNFLVTSTTRHWVLGQYLFTLYTSLCSFFWKNGVENIYD